MEPFEMRTEDPSPKQFELESGEWIKVAFSGDGTGDGTLVAYTDELAALKGEPSAFVPKEPGDYERSIAPAETGSYDKVLRAVIRVTRPLTEVVDIPEPELSKLRATDLGGADRAIRADLR